MTSVKCPDCSFVSRHERSMTARAMLGKHRRKEHGYVSPGAKYYTGSKKKVASGISPVDQPESSPQSETINTPNFCPCCGTNLRAVTAAMNLRRRQ